MAHTIPAFFGAIDNYVKVTFDFIFGITLFCVTTLVGWSSLLMLAAFPRDVYFWLPATIRTWCFSAWSLGCRIWKGGNCQSEPWNIFALLLRVTLQQGLCASLGSAASTQPLSSQGVHGSCTHTPEQHTGRTPGSARTPASHSPNGAGSSPRWPWPKPWLQEGAASQSISLLWAERPTALPTLWKVQQTVVVWSSLSDLATMRIWRSHMAMPVAKKLKICSQLFPRGCLLPPWQAWLTVQTLLAPVRIK